MSVVSRIEDTLKKYRMERTLEEFLLGQVISSHGPKAQDSEAGDSLYFLQPNRTGTKKKKLRGKLRQKLA